MAETTPVRDARAYSPGGGALVLGVALPGGQGLATVGLAPDGVVPTGPVVVGVPVDVEGEDGVPVPGAEVVVPVPVLDGGVVLVVSAVPDDVDGQGLLPGLVVVAPPIGVVVVDGVTVVPGVAVELPVFCPGTVVVVEPTPPDGTAGGMPPDGTPDGF